MTSVDPYNYWLRFGGTPYLENTKRITYEYQERKVFSYLRTKLKRKEIRTILEIGCGYGRFTQIESIVTPSGNSGHVVVPKAWIGKEAIVKLKEKEIRSKRKNQPRGEKISRVVMDHSS